MIREENKMKRRIILGTIFCIFLVLLLPHVSAIETNFVDIKKNNLDDYPFKGKIPPWGPIRAFLQWLSLFCTALSYASWTHGFGIFTLLFWLVNTLIFDPSSLNRKYWNGLSEEDKIKYYGRYGYGQNKVKLFTFICEHWPQIGHFVLMDMDNGQLLPMCHVSEFRIATDDEC